MLVSPPALLAKQFEHELSLGSLGCQSSSQAVKDIPQPVDEIEMKLMPVILHELRGSLSTIALSADILEEEIERTQRSKHLHRIQAKVRQITHLLENITLLVRGSSEQLKPHLTSTNLIEVCAGLVEEIQSTNNTHTLTFDYCNQDSNQDPRSQSNSWANAYVDEELWALLLANLVYNGIKYSPSGSTVSLSLIRQTDCFIFKVSDAGIGIAPEELPFVFDWFYRGSNSARASGSGLGLAIVKRCVELHLGTIAIHSSLRTGTQVTIHLPTTGAR